MVSVVTTVIVVILAKALSLSPCVLTSEVSFVLKVMSRIGNLDG